VPVLRRNPPEPADVLRPLVREPRQLHRHRLDLLPELLPVLSDDERLGTNCIYIFTVVAYGCSGEAATVKICATTLSIMTLNITLLSIMTLNTTTLRIMTLNITTLSIMKLNITTIGSDISIKSLKRKT
jgi:hypothetical protein